ncbi:MAG TPA: cyclic peptide export ABC transporter [Pyrinomonadaceae bacterium]|jgi:putative ATP-binding cassette transporter
MMKLFNFLWRNSPGVLLLSICVGVISGASSTGLIALIHASLNSDQASGKTLLMWGFIGLCLVSLLSGITSKIILIRIAQGATLDLRMSLSRQMLATSLRHLEELGPHRLLSTLTDDIPVISNALISIPLMCINFAIMVGCLIYLGWLSWLLLFAVLSFMIFGIITYQVPMTTAQRYLRAGREEHDRLLGHFRALTHGAKELKLHRQRREAFLTKVLRETAMSLRRRNFKGLATYTVAGSWGELLFLILIGLLIFALPVLRNIDARTLTGYALVVLYIMNPLAIILNTLPIMGRARIALQKIETLGLSLAAHATEPEALPLADKGSACHLLELEGVTHAYRGEREHQFVLGPLNLSFRAGELVFLTGGNGSGKTTFAKLLVGLYAPESGMISFNGRPVTDETREGYRQYFSVVFSDFYLFDSLLGIDTPELDAQAREYLVELQLDHKVEIREGLLSTTALSQGQRKRLALLTAYLEDRPFYVFDEWAADQDPQFKKIFYLQLLPELKARGKTVLVISHDDQYYYVADRLLRLNYGQMDYDRRMDSSLLEQVS